jgi:5-(carboxyamino)imidazole ribonucleotide synthase
VGVFCVELFHTPDDHLFINEIAPRPHNSGHYTLDACTVSQFEQQVRAVCGSPLGEVRQLSPAVMVNLIGAEAQMVTSGLGFNDLLSTPGARLHLYGKKVVRPGRKMGHVTFLADTGEEALELAHRFMIRFM